MTLSCFCHLVPHGSRCLNCYINWRNSGEARRVLPPPKPSCSVETCERIAAVRGKCYLHYNSMIAREARERAKVSA